MQDNTLMVFLGRGALAQGIRQALEDFSATGLINELVWVDADIFENSASLVTRFHTGPDNVPRISRQPFNELVSRSRARRIHLGIINVIDGADGMITHVSLSNLLTAIDSFSTNFEVHRSNLMITSVGAPLTQELPVFNGYVNLMLAPESSPGPDSSTVAYHHDSLDHRFVLHCTAGICSIYGLWEGSTDAPVTRMDTSSGRNFRLVRAFYRRIDGQAVQSRLKELILDTEMNPLPRLDEFDAKSITARYPSNPSAFVEKAAADLLEDFRDVLVVPETRASVQATRSVSVGGGVKELVREWGRMLVTAPLRMWRGVKGEAILAAGDFLQENIYGTGSSVMVGRGQAEITGTGASGDRRSVQADAEQRYAVELSEVWYAYANTSMSLLDASSRAIGPGESRRPGVVEGSDNRITVARYASDVIPGPRHSYGSDLPVDIKVNVDGGNVAPYDLLGIQEFEKRLNTQASSGQRGVSEVAGKFKQWQRQNSDSFAYHVGKGIQDRIEMQVGATHEFRRTIDRLRGSGPMEDSSGKWGRIFRWLGAVSLWSEIIFAAIWGIINWRHGAGEVLPLWVQHLNGAEPRTKWLFFGIWFGITVILWGAEAFADAMDSLRIRNRRRNILDELQAAEQSLMNAEENIDRLQVGYGQFLSVSRMMGTLLERPFGAVSDELKEAVIPLNAMPDSVIFAEAAPDSAAVEKLAGRFQSQIYRQGWLDERVMEGLATAKAMIAETSRTQIRSDEYFSELGEGHYSDLTRIADHLDGDEFRARDRSTGTWRSITAELADDPEGHSAGVLDSLQIHVGGQVRRAPAQEPLGRSVTTGSFNGEIATDTGRVSKFLELDPELCTYEQHANASDSIGVSEVLLQVGKTAQEEFVAFRVEETAPVPQALLDAMPVDEDSEFNRTSAAPVPSPVRRNSTQLPGMGEF